MELWNVNNERFQKEGTKIIKQQGELLIFRWSWWYRFHHNQFGR